MTSMPWYPANYLTGGNLLTAKGLLVTVAGGFLVEPEPAMREAAPVVMPLWVCLPFISFAGNDRELHGRRLPRGQHPRSLPLKLVNQ